MGFVMVRVEGKTFPYRNELRNELGLEYDWRAKDFKGAFGDKSRRLTDIETFCKKHRLTLYFDGEERYSPKEQQQKAGKQQTIKETEDLEDVAEETDVQADTNYLVSVETPQSSKAPGIKKASMVPGLAVLKRADLDSNHDRTPGRSTLVSPKTIKKLIESENLGELKTALGKLDITSLPPDVYELVRGSLDAVQEEMGKEILIGKTVVGSAIATSVGLSAGYVVWMLKGGSLLASLLSSLPAWQLADPLAILVGKKEDEDEDDDSLETIIKDGSRRDEDKESKASELDNLKKESAKR